MQSVGQSGASARRGHLLVADDQPAVVEALQLLFKSRGYQVTSAATPAGVLQAVERSDFHAALVDLNYSRDTTSGREGLELLTQLHELDPCLPVVVMTAWGSIPAAVKAMQAGARDFIEKPWNNERLVSLVATQVELCRALRQSFRLEGEAQRLRGQSAPQLLTRAKVMDPVLRLIERVGPSDVSVLITGEHGTGKEVVAHALHHRSPRCDGPMVSVNAGGLADGIFESELFGHVKGAFTDAKRAKAGCFEQAESGTLFLDEIGNMPLSQQSSLLRVLQTGEFRPLGSAKIRQSRARVIAATNAQLDEAVAAGAFREDLLYRLNTVEIALPPLRARLEDLPLFCEHILQKLARRYARAGLRLREDTARALAAHRWPGNVRELEHTLERAVLMSDADELVPEDLGLGATAATTGRPDAWETMTLDGAELRLIKAALQRNANNVSAAADSLGLSRSALYRRLARYEIRVP